MMKRISSAITGSLLVFSLIHGCVEFGEFNIPELQWEEDQLQANSNLQALASLLDQSQEELILFDESDDTVVSGYVISSDEAGSFYKTLIVQDKQFNPEIGIQIRIDLKTYYTKYRIGRKIYIKLSGLAATKQKGNYVLGYLLKDQVADIPHSLIDEKLIRSEELAELTGRAKSLEEINNYDYNTLVMLEDMQFSFDDLGKTFAGEIYDKYIGKRLLENCENGSRIWLQTSIYSDFRSQLIPIEKISIEGIVTKDPYSGEVILIINNLNGISLINEQRCDPEFFNCHNEMKEANEVIFYEDFDWLSSTKELESRGWLNRNVNYGNGKFKKRSKNENVFLQISAYNSGETTMEVWLVSPPINLDRSTGETLSFRSRATYDEGEILKVWISNEFNEDVRHTNWKQLDAEISRGSVDGSNEVYQGSGSISLDCFEGEVRIAFQYTGSDPGWTTTYDIDHILILGSK